MRISFCFLICFFCLVPLGPCSPPPVGGVTRPGYGIDFNFLYPINNMHGSWKHTWSIDVNLLNRNIPTLPQILTTCDNVKTPLCDRAADLVNFLAKEFSNVTKMMQDAFIWTSDPQLLATVNRQGPQNRRKRSLFPFVGDIEKFFFGIATESDINAIKSSIEDMTALHQTTIKETSQLGDNLASLTKSVGENLANTERGFQLVKEGLGNLTKSANERFKLIEQEVGKTDNQIELLELDMRHMYLIFQDIFPALIQALNVAHADMELLQGIQTIIQGYIPITLLPPQEIVHGLNIALRGIQDKFPQAQLSYGVDTLGYYYTHKIVTPFITPTTISLIVDIPVDLNQEILYVYAIRTFPVNLLPYNSYTKIVNPDVKHVQAQSLLVPESDNFLISPEGDFWSLAKDSELSPCKGESIRFCPKQFALYSINHDHCLTSLWKNAEFETILSTCHYELIHIKNPIKAIPYVSVTALSNGRWFIQSPTDTKWTISCPNRPPEIRDPCTSCIITVDCGCGVNSPWFKIPTRVSTCDNVFSPLSRNFTINPFGYLPKNYPWIVNLTGTTDFSTAPHWIPDITIPDNGNWDDVMESFDSKKFDLNRLYLKTVNESKMYRSEAEALLQKIKNQDRILASLSGWPDWILGLALTLTFANTAIIGLSCFCFFARVKALPVTGIEQKLVDLDYDIITIDMINLILTAIVLFIVFIMIWPVMIQWFQHTKLYRMAKKQSRQLKAIGYRKRRGWVSIIMEGELIFENYLGHLGRTRILTGASPLGTMIADQNPRVLLVQVTSTNGFYRFTLPHAITLIQSNGETRDVASFPMAADYVHRKLNIPITNSLITFKNVQIWIQ